MKEKPNQDSFSYRLRQLRKKQNLTQQGLADKLNVHVTTVKNWENCCCLSDVENVCIIADALHVTTDYLLGREENERIPLEGLTERERKQLFQIIQAYIDGLPPRSKQEKSR